MHEKLALFIHGLGGNAKDTWQHFPDLVRADTDLASFDIGYYEFPTSLVRLLPFFGRSPGIQTLADGLRTELRYRYAAYKEVTLVCHSLGGLVAKRCLTDQLDQEGSTNVARALFYAVPSDGSGLAAVAQLVSWKHPQLRQLCRDSDMIREVARGWSRVKADSRFNVRYIVAGNDQAVSEQSARVCWGNVQVDVVVQKGHRDIVKPLSSGDTSFLIFKQTALTDLPSPLNNAEALAARQRSIAADGSMFLDSRPDHELRIAISSIGRIVQGGKYLLVRNLHRPDSFAPFGGVLKMTEGGRRDLDALSFRPQVAAPDMHGDLRGFIPIAKLTPFLEWLESNTGREDWATGLLRELAEELGEISYPLMPTIGDLALSKIRVVVENAEFIPSHKYNQFRMFAVHDISAQSERGRQILSDLFEQAQAREGLLAVTSQEIIEGRAGTGEMIAAHAPYLFGHTRYRSPDPLFPSR